MKSWASLALVVLLVANATACKREESSPAVTTSQTEKSRPSLACLQQRLSPGDLTGWNLLLITMDTTRADRLGCYGYDGAATPALDRLVATGAVFDHAVTPVPATLPAHCSILTGLEAPHHGVRTNGHYNLAEEQTTLAEILRDRGYATAAFVATFVLNRRFGSSQGFDTYDDALRRPEPESTERAVARRADYQTDVAVEWLSGHLQRDAGRPFFMWVHYFDPHLPYDPPGEIGERFADRPYDGEIAYMDVHLQRLIDFFDSKKLTEKTLIVVTADHGEGLGEHLEKDHSRLIYDTTMHVPLIINCPALYDGSCRVDDITVGLIDIMPTALSLLGIDSGLPLDGLNLLTADVPENRAIYIETVAPLLYHGWASLHGLRRRDAKFIQAPIPEYYDLSADPHELTNLLAADARAADEPAAELDKVMSAWPPIEETAKKVDRLSERVAQNLAALGYVSSRSDGVDTDVRRPDPKDMVPVFELLRKESPNDWVAASWEIVQLPGKDAASYRRALILAQEAHERRAGGASAQVTLAFAYYRVGHAAEAMEALQRVDRATLAENDPVSVYSMACRVLCLQKLGRSDQTQAAMALLRDAMAPASAVDDDTARRLLREAESAAGGA